MSSSPRPGFFAAIIDPQSYLNILYLLVALPLGILYFVFLVTGLSLGAGLLITLAGIPILLFILAGSSVLCRLERVLAVRLLKMDIPPRPREVLTGSLWFKTKTLLSDRLTWNGVLYLIFKFPIGVAAFTLAVTLLAVSIAFVFAPAYMWASDPLVWSGRVFDPYPWAWVLTVIGIPVAFLSLNVLNVMASGLGRMTKAMLGQVHQPLS